MQCGRTEEIKDPAKRFPKKEQISFQMKLEDFIIDNLLKTTTYENNFKFLMDEKKIKKIFPEQSFHGKDETFQIDDGKALFKEAISMIPESLSLKSKKNEVSPGYQLKKLKRKSENLNIIAKKIKSIKKIKK